jgi:hypothetical protein
MPRTALLGPLTCLGVGEKVEGRKEVPVKERKALAPALYVTLLADKSINVGHET